MDRRVSPRVQFFWTLLAGLALTVASPASAQQLPSGWAAQDVGSVGANGGTWASGNYFAMLGSGADIWGTSDGFHFAYRTLTGDGVIVARVTRVDWMDAWSKAGVMMRSSLSANASHAFMLVSAGNGNAFQRRRSNGGASSHTAASGGQFVALVRTGDKFEAYSSWDGTNWSWVGSETISMPSTIYVGLAVTSHYWGAQTTAEFSDVSVSTSGSSSSKSSASSSSSSSGGSTSYGLPGGWGAQDIGGVAAAGWSMGGGSDFQLGGSGGDIWGTADEFQFAYSTLSGDGAIVARVTGVEWRDAWTKAGVMMRESLSAGSPHAFMLVSAGKGLAFQWRQSQGGSSGNASLGWGSAPYWVMLSRSGNNFYGYVSQDGKNWSLAGSATIAMGSTIYVGFAVTSHSDGNVAYAAFSNAAVNAGAQATPAPPQSSGGGSSSSGGGGGSSSFRLLHWNVHHLIGTDGVYDPYRIANWIAYLQPDIVSLNEVDDAAQADIVRRAVNAATGRTWHTTYSGWGNLILSRFPINSNSVCSFNPGAGRLAAHASVTISGRAVNLWSAHLATDGSGTRLYEVSMLHGCATNWSEARIIAGDYNMQQWSSEYNSMASVYTDAWAAASANGAAWNFSGNCDGCTRNSRIDYVFSSKGAWFLGVESAQVVDTRDGYGYMPSDHKPLIVTYTVY